MMLHERERHENNSDTSRRHSALAMLTDRDVPPTIRPLSASCHDAHLQRHGSSGLRVIGSHRYSKIRRDLYYLHWRARTREHQSIADRPELEMMRATATTPAGR